VDGGAGGFGADEQAASASATAITTAAAPAVLCRLPIGAHLLPSGSQARRPGLTTVSVCPIGRPVPSQDNPLAVTHFLTRPVLMVSVCAELGLAGGLQPRSVDIA